MITPSFACTSLFARARGDLVQVAAEAGGVAAVVGQLRGELRLGDRAGKVLPRRAARGGRLSRGAVGPWGSGGLPLR